MYPHRYRARETDILAGWIRAGESGSIVGLAGAGKSNLLGFLCHRTEAITRQYEQQDLAKLALILVDLNDLPGDDSAAFYRTILRSLYEARTYLATIEGSLFTTVRDTYRRVEEKTDPFLSQSALREALLAFREQDVRLVLVLDPFDRFCRAATTQVLDTLRGLRDSFKTSLSYLVGLRHELASVRDPAELGELYEILDTHLCWLGPMEREDARWVIAQVEEGVGHVFESQHVECLIDLTGGYPALVRATSLWLARASRVPEVAAWEERLLAAPSVHNRLKEMWMGLTGEEQAALTALGHALTAVSAQQRCGRVAQIEREHHHAFAQLRAKRLCTINETGLKTFPLLARFAADLQGTASGRICHDRDTDRILRGTMELADMSAQDRRLLRHFLDHPAAVCTVDDLIDAAWTEYDSSGVTDAAVQQAIRHLRKQIEPDPSHPRYLVTERGLGYRFFPEGAPRT